MFQYRSNKRPVFFTYIFLLNTFQAAKRLVGVTPEVNLDEHVTHTPPPSVNKAAYSGFEAQRRCHQKSKTGVSVAPQKDLCSPKFFLEKTLKKPISVEFNEAK